MTSRWRILRTSAIDFGDSRIRFVQEARITAQLQHPGIVPIYGFGTYADGRPYYAMRFGTGKSMKEAIRQFHTSHSPAISIGPLLPTGMP